MQKSDSIKLLSKALTNVQKEIKPAVKDSNNPYFKSKYADLNSVWDTSRDLLAKNGLSVAQGNSVGMDNTVIVETLLMHESGEWIQSELCLPLAKHDPQGVGSAVTYGRRYGLAAMIGVVADVDDDGNGASKTEPNKKPAQIKSVEQPTAREGMVRAVQLLGKTLNQSGDSITWGLKTTNEYVNNLFGDGIDLSNANEAQLTTLMGDMQDRLAALTEGK